VPALQNGQIDGFATSGSYPAPNVIEAAAAVDIDILSLSDEQIEQTGRTRIVIPANTYAGVDHPVATTSLSVAAYCTTEMDDDTAYQLTKTFWEQKKAMGKSNAWWKAVTLETLPSVGTTLHPGALKYYREVGADIPQDMQ
jgi:TRAP transporter TAXI family solute receptor